VLVQTAPRTFSSPQFYAVGVNPVTVAAGNLNADLYPDIVVANAGSNNVSVLLGAANGSFSSPITYALPGIEPIGVAIGDIDGDGIMDLAVAMRTSNDVQFLRGVGDGNFHYVEKMPVNVPYGITLADLDGNGRLDLVAATNHASATIFLVPLISTVNLVGLAISG